MPELYGPSIPNVEIPPHPAHENNERLARVEDQFGRIQGIAAEAASVANGLQGAAAEFLVKFEKAAKNNDRAAGRAIRLGVIAILIAVAMPFFQVAYEFWRVPTDTAATQIVLTELKAEIAALREAQSSFTRRMAVAVDEADQTRQRHYRTFASFSRRSVSGQLH